MIPVLYRRRVRRAAHFASGDKIRTQIGAAALTGAVTIAIVCRTDSSRDGAWRNLMLPLNASLAPEGGYWWEIASGNVISFTKDNGTSGVNSTTQTVAADGLCAHIVTKAAGTVTPRYHRFKWSTGAWVHEAMSGTMGDTSGNANTAYELLGDGGGSGDNFVGDAALAFLIGRDLTDSEIESIIRNGRWLDLARLMQLRPVAVWPIWEPKVRDLTGRGANENSRTGTRVANGAAEALPLQGVLFPIDAGLPLFDAGGATTTPISGTDTGTETETSAIAATASTTDAGSETEASQVAATAATSDTGTESETSQVASTLATTDAGSAGEASQIAASVSSAGDSGSLSESSTVQPGATGADTATLGESSQVAVVLATADSATLTDLASSIAAALAASDVVAEAEAITLAATRSTSDAASLSEASSVVPVVAGATPLAYTLSDRATVEYELADWPTVGYALSDRAP